MESGDAGTPLSVNDFSFHGFEDLVPQLTQQLRDVGIRRSGPSVSIVENAVYVPTIEINSFQAAGYAKEGAIVTSDGLPITAAQSRWRAGRWGDRLLGDLSAPVAVAPERQIEEDVVYLGWYFGHFGHFLLESLARTWILPELERSLRVVFHSQRRPTPSGTPLTILEAFGVSLDRILVLDTQTRLRRVIIPEPLYELAHSAHVRLPQLYREVAATVATETDTSEQPIYLSRRLLPSRKRPIVGEYEMEEVMRENGFLIVHPETMTFEDQVRLVNRHRDIFTSAGSAAYMSLFSLTPPRLHFLTSGVPFADYFLVSKAAGFQASFSNSLAAGHRAAIYYAPPLVAIDTLCDYLESRGFMKSTLRSSLLKRGRGFRQDYDEAWLYAYVRTLPEDDVIAENIEPELMTTARKSWPLCWLLARHFAIRTPDRVEDLAQRFIELVPSESDLDRLAHYHADVARHPERVVKHCSADTQAQLSLTLRRYFSIDLAARPQRSGRLRPKTRRRDG